MKFCKIFEFDDDQILLRKGENDEAEFTVDFIIATELGEMASSFVYTTEDARNEWWNAITEDMVKDEYLAMQKQATALGLGAIPEGFHVDSITLEV